MAAAAAGRRALSGEGGSEGGLRCPPCRAESALAAAAAATTGETAAPVGEAAADEEEGEAAAAAKENAWPEEMSTNSTQA